ncbi:MAG: pseudouridine synthase [Deltaproteobacteria bacterium]|jgi:pseudouridine synthase|nr:MAG: pseudouridine synthase [Deltaproteobacteria bacterium]
MEKKNDRKKERLNKIIAMAGITSRRRADGLISLGLVTVNGRVEKRVGSKAVWGIDTITVDGQPIPDPPKKIYLLLNKPFGYVSTLNDPEGRPIIRDLIRDVNERVYPVGRLDFDSSGLLILTNDGELAFRLMHPRFHIPRTYKVIVEGSISDKSVERLKKGVVLYDGTTNPARVRIIDTEQERSVVRITIFEGRSREIRRMFDYVGHKTLKLIRIGYGNLDLGDLKVGKYRHLKNVEVKALRTSVGLD